MDQLEVAKMREDSEGCLFPAFSASKGMDSMHAAAVKQYIFSMQRLGLLSRSGELLNPAAKRSLVRLLCGHVLLNWNLCPR